MEQKKSTTFFDIISDIEGDTAPLDEIIAALILFDELLRNSVGWLDPLKPYTVDLFTRRFDLLASMLNMIQRELEQHNSAIHADITNAYRLHAEFKSQGTA